jgi:hypothetical protein
VNTAEGEEAPAEEQQRGGDNNDDQGDEKAADKGLKIKSVAFPELYERSHEKSAPKQNAEKDPTRVIAHAVLHSDGD